MKKLSAGILVYRVQGNVLQVLLGHAGGPFWAKKDDGAWSIFKGEAEQDEDLVAAAGREFGEETGQELPDAPLIPLGDMKRKDGKIIQAWAVEANYDPAVIKSNTFEMEWPPHSGKQQAFSEIDRATWFDVAIAPQKMHQGQGVFVDRLVEKLHAEKPDILLESSVKQTSDQPTLF